jgi:hypothetical protein
MIKVYLDEDVPEAVAIALRLRGYNVLTTQEARNKSLSDRDQIASATSEGRVLFTHNVADFLKIHKELMEIGRNHPGIIVSRQRPIGVMVKALLRLLSGVSPEGAENQILWLSDWIYSRTIRHSRP